MGSYEELISSSKSFSRLLEDINQHQQERQQEYEGQTSVLSKQQSKVDSISTLDEEREDASSLLTNIEMKQEGIVKWSAYVAYLRAGIGAFVGLLLLFVVFSSQQAVALYSNWWLAGWSNDEGHRHRYYNDCASVDDSTVNRIRSMNEDEWNIYRNQRFYIYCGLLLNSLCCILQ